MPRLSLTELKKAHADHGRMPLSVKVDGHVDLVVKNEDGSVDQAVSKSNLTTQLWPLSWQRYNGPNLRSLTMFIAPDDNGQMETYKTMIRHLYPENYAVSVTATLNATTETWTYTGVFGLPSLNRVFRYVGLCSNVPTEGTARAAGGIFAMTRMTSDISQTTTQTLEVVYRVSFSRA